MTFTRIKPTGFTTGETITAAQINQLDTDHANAIDGAAGGTFIPSSVLELYNTGVEFADGFYPTCTERTQWRVCSMNPLMGSDDWTLAAGRYRQINAADEVFFAVDNRVWNGSITSVKIGIIGAAGHGALPSPMPKFYLIRINGDGTTTSVGNAEDLSVNTTAYQSIHDITLGGIDSSEDQDSGQRHIIQVVGEGAANFVAAMEIEYVMVQWTFTDLMPGG